MGMKAYYVTDKNYGLGYGYVVFAEKRSKAIRHALLFCDDAFDCCAWTDIRAIRRPQLDSFYRGVPEMDWENEADRVAMVRYAGFYCSDDAFETTEECERCVAHEWCVRYEYVTAQEGREVE